jgi:hypothetical protein
MDTTTVYARRRIIAICSALAIVIIIATLIIWNTLVLHVVAVDPLNGRLPTVQQTITITYSQKLVDAKVISFTPQLDYTTSVKGENFIIRLAETQPEDIKLNLKVEATSARGKIASEFSFTGVYVNYADLSDAQQTQLINESDGISDRHPLDGHIPHIDVAAPYSIDYGDSAQGQTALPLVISNSSPNGRAAALRWIREAGYDPTTLDIRYDEYVNPLTSQETE